MNRVLIVSASAGNGHVKAGEALRAQLELVAERVEHVDILDLAPRWVRAAYGGGFELLASHAPRLWREVYERSDGAGRDAARWGPLAHRLLFRGFRRLLLSEPWQSCICTHFLPSQLAAGRPGHPPFSLVVTDFALHRFWVQPRVHEYYVAHDALARELGARLPTAVVTASGIPVAKQFAERTSMVSARARAQLDPGRPIALVMGGGLGIGVEESVHAALTCNVPGLQLIAVCGRNDGARDRLSHLGVSHERLRVSGYVDNIPDLIAASDVVVTKPGGLTCSETLALGRPLLLTRAIPGHEEANARFLTGCGAAVSAPDASAISAGLLRTLNDPSIGASAWAMGRPDAARDVAAHLMRNHFRRAAA